MTSPARWRSRAALAVLAVVTWIIVGATSAYAQAVLTGTVEATVLDAQAAALPGATVTLRDVARGTTQSQVSSDVGRVQFIGVPVGTYTLVAELTGFNQQLFSDVQVNPGSRQAFKFELQVGNVQETITVAAEAPLLNTRSAQESTSVDDKYLESLPLITRNYTEMATIFPGVSYSRGARTAYNQFNVRGGDQTGNAYLLDGGSLNRGVGRAGILVAPSFIERMEFIPGGFPAEYAGFQSSVINIVSKSGANQTHGFVSGIVKPNALISNIDSGLASQVRDKPLGSTKFIEASVGGPIRRDKLWYYAGMQYNSEEQGTILSLDPQPRNITVYPFHMKYSYQRSADDRWDLTAHAGPFTDNYSQLSTEIAPESDRKQDINTWNTVLRNTRILSASSVLESQFQTFYMSFHNNRINDEDPIPPGTYFVRYFDRGLNAFYTRGPSPDRTGVSAEARFRASAKWTRTSSAHTVKVGGEWTEVDGRQPRYREVPNFQDLRARPGGGPVTRQDPYGAVGSLRDRLFGVFVQDSWTPSDRVTVDAGVRVDWQDRAGFETNVSPRLGLTFLPTGSGRSKLFANAGLYYSNLFDNIFGFADSRPAADITYTIQNPDANLVGNAVVRSIQRFGLADDLHNPYTMHVSTGYEQILLPQLKGTVSYVWRRGVHQPSADTRTISSIEVLQIQATAGRLKYQGIEFVLQKAYSNRWDGLISYTLGRARDDASGVLSPVQRAFSYGPADYDQRHTFTGTGTVVMPLEVRFTGLVRYASGRPYSITNDDTTIFAAYVNPQGQVTGRNQEQQPSNATVDFTVARDFELHAGANLRALVQVINAANRVNITNVSRSLSTAGRPTNIDLSRQIQFGMEIRF